MFVPTCQHWNAGFFSDLLKRLDRDLAELHHALPILERERSLDPHAVADLGRLLAVEHRRDIAAIRRDFVGVPFAATTLSFCPPKKLPVLGREPKRRPSFDPDKGSRRARRQLTPPTASLETGLCNGFMTMESVLHADHHLS